MYFKSSHAGVCHSIRQWWIWATFLRGVLAFSLGGCRGGAEIPMRWEGGAGGRDHQAKIAKRALY